MLEGMPIETNLMSHVTIYLQDTLHASAEICEGDEGVRLVT